MDLKNILEQMKEPERLNDPRDVQVLASYVSSYISHFEEELSEQNYQVSSKWAELRKELKTSKETDQALELTEIYRTRETTKLNLAKFRRFRADLRSRLDILTNKRY